MLILRRLLDVGTFRVEQQSKGMRIRKYRPVIKKVDCGSDLMKIIQVTYSLSIMDNNLYLPRPGVMQHKREVNDFILHLLNFEE